MGVLEDKGEDDVATVAMEWLRARMRLSYGLASGAAADMAARECGCGMVSADMAWPGQHVAREMERRGMGVEELARASGLTAVTVRRVIGGNAPIDAHVAVGLERAWGLDAALWLDMQRLYNEARGLHWLRVDCEADSGA